MRVSFGLVAVLFAILSVTVVHGDSEPIDDALPTEHNMTHEMSLVLSQQRKDEAESTAGGAIVLSDRELTMGSSYETVTRTAVAGDTDTDTDTDKAREQRLAEAKQFEADASDMMARGSHRAAAHCYSLAANHYTILGDVGKTREMNGAAAGQFEAAAGDAIVRGSHIWAAHAYSEAAKYCTILGDVDKAREMKAAAVQQYEAEAGDELARGNRRAAAVYYSMTADLYNALGDVGKAHEMKAAAMGSECEGRRIVRGGDEKQS